MRLLFIFNYRPYRGGLSGQVEQLISDLQSEKIDVKIFSTSGSIIYRAFCFFGAIYHSFKSELIISAGSAFRGLLPMFIASLAAKISLKPIIFNYHDGQIEEHFKKSSKLIRWVIGDNPVVVATDFLRDTFVRNGIDAVKIINHFNFQQLFPTPNSKPACENKLVLWARGFYDLYQPELALKIAKKCCDINQEIVFHFYGDGPLLKDLADKYQHDRIIFKGLVKRSEFLEKVNEYGILLNTTKHDNFPLSIVEAAYNKLSVVSTKIGGIETIFDSEEINYFSTVDEAKTIIMEIFSFPEKYTERTRKARSKVETFTWEKVRGAWLELITERIRE